MIIPQFKMWIGVVESRTDPENLGRYRVRVLGYHTDNKQELPTENLPWAVPIMPVTSASISGVGTTPRLVEGSTVVGFWADGEDEQQPVIMGSLPGIPTAATDPKKGFADPSEEPGRFPRTGADAGYNKIGEPDISRLARGKDAETHASLKEKRRTRLQGMPVAKAYAVKSVGENLAGVDYESKVWDEPHPRFGSTDTGTYTEPGSIPTFENGTTSVYPYNHVTETETGHIFEVDDTPGNGRIHEYHNSGTFYEIQADGTKVTKIVGDSYEMVMNGKNIAIVGECNVTIGGNCKLRIDGNYYQEIGGNMTTFVKGSRHTKIEGNDLLEVGTNVGVSIKSNYAERVGGNYHSEVIKSRSLITGAIFSSTSGKNTTINASKALNLTAGTSIKGSAGIGNLTLLAPLGTIRASGLGMSLTGTTSQVLASASTLIETTGVQTIVSGGLQTIVSGAAQSITAAAAQTISTTAVQTLNSSSQSITAGSQSITASSRTITGTTSHTGAYTVTGALSGTTVSQGSVVLGTHRHAGVQTGGGTTTTPI